MKHIIGWFVAFIFGMTTGVSALLSVEKFITGGGMNRLIYGDDEYGRPRSWSGRRYATPKYSYGEWLRVHNSIEKEDE